MILMITK